MNNQPQHQHGFLHGIRRFYPAACVGLVKFPCLPILALFFNGSHACADNGLQCALKATQDDGDDGNCPSQFYQAVNSDLQPQEGQNNGDLQPTRGDEDETQNCDLLQPTHRDEEAGAQKIADNYDLQQQKKGDLPPMRGEESNPADNHDVLLQPMQCDDGYCPSQNAENFNLQEEKGDILTTKGEDLPVGGEHKKNIDHYYNLQQQVKKEDDNGEAEITHAQVPPFMKLMPRPRVKMKGNMMLNDVHAWEHNAWACPSSPSISSISSILATINFTFQAFLLAADINNSPILTDSAENETTSSRPMFMETMLTLTPSSSH